MNELKQKVMQNNAVAFTHKGKFHADDVFASALLLYLNPEIEIIRGNQVPEDFAGIVFDIGRGKYDHHQKDSRIRENGIPFAAFGLLWEELGGEILGENLALRFDEEIVQPLDQNDNTGERNELASLIGDFNLSWDEDGDNDDAFFEAVRFASMILENKFAKYLGNERADQQVEQMMAEQQQGELGVEDKIFVMKQFVPCQKKLSGTDIAFIVFPSNRGGFCIQPLKKEGSMNYKCNFPENWLGLEQDELKKETGLQSAIFCHKGGFIMTVGTVEDAVEACRISQKRGTSPQKIIYASDLKNEIEIQKKIKYLQKIKIPGYGQMELTYIAGRLSIPFKKEEDILEVNLEKVEWKELQKDFVKTIIHEKPEYVVVDGTQLFTYPLIHLLRKKKVNVLTFVEIDHELQLVKVPSGS